MSFDPLSAAFDLGTTVINKIWPDPIKQAEELRKLQELKQNGDLASLNAHVQLMLGQLGVNEQEAKHKSIFVAGWRPFIGWVGGLSMAYQFLIYPMLIWIWAILQANGIVPTELLPPPILDTDALWVILTGMLGIGGMRSLDKYNNKDTSEFGK